VKPGEWYQADDGRWRMLVNEDVDHLEIGQPVIWLKKPSRFAENQEPQEIKAKVVRFGNERVLITTRARQIWVSPRNLKSLTDSRR
jgi:hypothetical protein